MRAVTTLGAPLHISLDAREKLVTMCEILFHCSVDNTEADKRNPEVFTVQSGRHEHVYHWFELLNHKIVPALTEMLGDSEFVTMQTLYSYTKEPVNLAYKVFSTFYKVPPKRKNQEEKTEEMPKLKAYVT